MRIRRLIDEIYFIYDKRSLLPLFPRGVVKNNKNILDDPNRLEYQSGQSSKFNGLVGHTRINDSSFPTQSRTVHVNNKQWSVDRGVALTPLATLSNRRGSKRRALVLMRSSRCRTCELVNAGARARVLVGRSCENDRNLGLMQGRWRFFRYFVWKIRCRSRARLRII